jgi:hypothetical protein
VVIARNGMKSVPRTAWLSWPKPEQTGQDLEPTSRRSQFSFPARLAT